MAIRIAEQQSFRSSLLIGIATLAVILVFIYVFIYQSGLFVKNQAQPPQALIGAQQQLTQIQSQTQNLSSILSSPLISNSVRFGNLPIQPPQPGRSNPFSHY